MFFNRLEDLSDLTLLRETPFSSVYSGMQEDQPVVLKKARDREQLKREAQALQAFAESGAVRVLAEGDGVLLMERAIPGLSLKSYFPERDDEGIGIAATVIKRLHQAPLPRAGAFPHIHEWLVALDKTWDIPAPLLEKARKLRDHLLQTSAPSVLLHGDMHHENILKHGEEGVVIDPKGVIGEPVYEVSAFIRNPLPELLDLPDVACLINQRIHQFSALLGLDETRLKNWCFVQAVLAWIWAIEDGCDEILFKKLIDVIMENLN